MKRSIAMAALLTPLLTIPVGSANQEVVFRASISAEILVDSPAYSRAPANENLVFPGTPLVVLLRAGNSMTPKVDGAAATVVVERDWPNFVRIRLSRGTKWEARTLIGEVTCQPLHSVPVRRPSTFAGFFELADGADTTLKCLLDPGIVDTLRPGDYVIEADWNDERLKAGLRRHPANAFKNIPGFSIREVNDAMDALEVEIRHMSFALRHERFAEAIDFANRVLLTEPSSVRALAARALANVGLRRCGEAASDMERAAAAVEFGTDVNAWPSGQDRLRHAEALRRPIVGCR